MKSTIAVFCAGTVLLCGGRAQSQSPQSDELAALRRQVEALTSRVNDLQQQVNQGRLAPVFSDPATSGGSKPIVVTGAPAQLAAPKETNLAIFNPEISAAIDVIGSYSGRADQVNFIVRDAEIVLRASVDHLAHAYAALNAETELDPTEKAEPFEEVSLGIEEAAIETTALPYGLKVKAGLFFADFTQLGKVHSHELPFSDRPRSLDLIIGGEDKARGLEFSWIPPLGHDARLTAGVVDDLGAEEAITSQLGRLDGGEGAATFRGGERRTFGDLMVYGRAATIFELGPRVSLNLGGNFARGRDRGERQIASGDFKLTWTPRPDRYDLFELSGEYLWTQNRGAFSDAALFSGQDSGTARADGGYVYAQYRLGKTWQPGVRFDWLRANTFAERDRDGDGAPDAVARVEQNTRTYSAYLNYHLSESNRLRLQVSYLDGDDDATAGAGDDWQAFFQWTIAIGPHKHQVSRAAAPEHDHAASADRSFHHHRP